MSKSTLEPNRVELKRVFQQKYGDPNTLGWSPKTRNSFDYYTPDEYYGVIVSKLVGIESAWIDVGGGKHLFPDNPVLESELAARCRQVVAVDPSDNVEENQIVKQRIKKKIEELIECETFDLATLRMVAEHIESPKSCVAALSRLVKPKGRVVVYTINKWSPVAVASWLTPHWIHHPIKYLLWKTKEEDTFPVSYKMNTRRRLRLLFHQAGFQEEYFAYLDDCRAFHRFRLLSYLELLLWRGLRMIGIRYPETCLLGVYRRKGSKKSVPLTAEISC